MKRLFTAGLAALMLVGLAAPGYAEPRLPPIPKAVIADPTRDAAHPADMAAFTVPTGGVRVNALMYLASGDQPHPTMLFLHGFPGNETNIDLMQAVRRAGWNVLKINYRGSWGSPGKFSFANARRDGEAATAFLFDPANVAKYHIDTSRIVVAGHSMGGFMAADAAAAEPRVAGTVLIDAWDIGKEKAGITDAAARKAAVEGMRPDTVPLAGTSAELLVKEIETDAAKLDLEALSARIAARPLLLVGAEHAGAPTTRKLAAAARQAQAKALTETYMDTDHSFSDSRIALEAEVIRWLGQFDPASAKPGTPQIPLKAPYDENNPFAKILRGEIVVPKVYEDDQVLAFMDHAPAEPGHVLVISKTSKARNILEISPQDLSRIMAVAARVGQAQVDSLGVEGFTIVQNNGVGQSVPHLHIHVIPRQAGKPLMFVENEKGDPKAIEALAAKIRAAMK
ncbi:alpha/beta fold hydrolase [Caulobacter soli]|uniref:alpha/beta fold hydrolase n=1 Tax=Caulobacter soli TaxID=2708539 RepID=UPI0013ED85EA|nr:alpha/beta fold hydrolase [Caulobacter soli]